ELALLSEAIVMQLRGRGVAVDSLRFRVGAIEAPERPPTRSEVRKEPPSVPLPPEVRAELARIDDPELRDAIARAASKNLGWQAAREAPPKPRARRSPATPSAPTSGAAPPPTSARPADRAPRSAGRESAPPDRTSKPSSA